MKVKLNYTQIIALGFLAIIFVGAFLLSLPISVKDGVSVSFFEALFVATSATCVTGLTVVDTYSTWSGFGQLVLLSLIQTGGLGFMTVITMVFIFMKRKISLRERKLLMQSAGTVRISGVVRLIRRIVLCTALFEGAGAVLIALSLYGELGFGRGLYYGIFHSVSAFCNAGFDLFGFAGKFSSLTSVYDNVLLNVTVMALIVTGGLGFIVWEDIYRNKLNFSAYSLHSKIVISFSAVLLFGGAAGYFVFEHNHAFADMSLPEKITASFFQSVTFRTAGFNTADLTALSSNGRFLSLILMLIGGGSGSTAGGIKVTTFAVLVLSALSAIRANDSVTAFKKRFTDDALKQAQSILLVYVFMIVLSFFIMGAAENFSSGDLMFEIVSAVGTVGVTMGITPYLSAVSKILLMILMFGGRIGGLTFMLFLAENRRKEALLRPSEKIIIG